MRVPNHQAPRPTQRLPRPIAMAKPGLSEATRCAFQDARSDASRAACGFEFGAIQAATQAAIADPRTGQRKIDILGIGRKSKKIGTMEIKNTHMESAARATGRKATHRRIVDVFWENFAISQHRRVRPYLRLACRLIARINFCMPSAALRSSAWKSANGSSRGASSSVAGMMKVPNLRSSARKASLISLLT